MSIAQGDRLIGRGLPTLDHPGGYRALYGIQSFFLGGVPAWLYVPAFLPKTGYANVLVSFVATTPFCRDGIAMNYFELSQ